MTSRLATLARGAVLLSGISALAVLAPVVARAPRRETAPDTTIITIEDAIAACRISGLQGWELVDYATALVNSHYSHYSIWHVWESPGTSFANRRGHANQYNQALGRILEGLGLSVRYVHAARVRLDRNPWWHAGHTWLRVTIDGRVRDVCASKAENSAGRVAFTPVTPVRSFRTITKYATTCALYPIVVAQIWQSWREDAEIPRWIYRPFNEPI